MLSTESVAAALAPMGVPEANVRTNWPQIYAGLVWAGITDRATQIAAAGTCVVETGIFAPIEEEGDWAYFVNEFGNEAEWHGRGYIQLSWKNGYAHAGQELGIDLVDNPALALQPAVAGKILAMYFKEHGVPAMANAGDWYGVRRAINGGENGISVFLQAVNALAQQPDGPPPAPPVTKVAIAGALKQEPNNTCPAAIGPDHQPVHLAVGQVVTFSKDADFPSDPGDITTPHYAHISLPNSPVHGWYLRASLQTVGG